MLQERVSRTTRFFRRLMLVLVLLLCVGAAAGRAIWVRQGLTDAEWAAVSGAHVTMDAHGVPTITATSWSDAIETQGYVTAANRLFQMDLMRRGAGGQLAAWFGEPALQVDLPRREEDWSGQAEWLAANLPADERRLCDAYAAGVNRFITDRPWGWGLEYVVLRQRPEPWTCADTMLVLLAMAADLSSTAEAEAQRAQWSSVLPDAWDRFIFPVDHPWNLPLFGPPTAALRLPSGSLEPGAAPGPAPVDTPTPGSNNWAWRGTSGTFLANDPHLGARVPHLWFLVRIRVEPARGEDEWVVGSTIPGLPGVVLGMNAHLAWAFTNVGEDVDDYLLEQVSDDGARYVVDRDAAGAPIWEPIERRPYEITLADGSVTSGVGLHTRRGPLARRTSLGGRWASRSWLPLKRDVSLAHLPAPAFARARDLDEINAAIDGFAFPAQNVLVADRQGSLLYRSSGTGIVRQIRGDLPQDALDGEWLGLASAASRPRLVRAVDEAGPVWLATANQRIWNEGYDHRWDSDARAARIREVLSGREDFSRLDMEALQLDTYSRYHHILVQWALARHRPRDQDQREAMARWAKWDGVAEHDPRTFTEALALAASLESALLNPVRALLPPDRRDLPYSWNRSDAWVLAVLGVGPEDGPAPTPSALFAQGDECKAGFAAFGLDEAETVSTVIAASLHISGPYYEANRWRAQHPFVGRVPLLGDLFAIDEPQQRGFSDLVRVEQPKFGASVRFVWDLRQPHESTWITPVGQSGHLRSPHYRDLQALWHDGKRLLALPDGWLENSVPRQ